MSLNYTLLGLVMLRPSTGYDLKKMIDESTSYLMPVTLRQVYPMLKKLTEAGQLSVTVEPQTGKPDRKVYAITEAGRSALFNWLAEPIPHDHHRRFSLLVLKLLFSSEFERSVLLFHVDRELQKSKAQLESHQQNQDASLISQYISHLETPQSEAIFLSLHELVSDTYASRVKFLTKLKARLEDLK